MPLRVKFTTPISFAYRGLILDRIDDIDMDPSSPGFRQVTANVILLPADGSRKRSEKITFMLTPAAFQDLANHCLTRLQNRVLRIDGIDWTPAGTIEDVPDGTPIP